LPDQPADSSVVEVLMRVVGLGQCCWDTVMLVASYPVVDSKVEVLAWREEGGGPVATALVTLARLGIDCRFHGIVGDDLTGARIQQELLQEGIDSRVVIRPGGLSQRASIIVEQATGRRTIVWQRPTGAALQPEEIPADLLAGASFLHLDGLMVEASLAAVRRARQQGIPIMLDAGRLRPGMQELAALCTHVVAAEQFAHDMGWDGTRDGFRTLAEGAGYPMFTVTCGERGSLTWTNGDLLAVPAYRVPVVDTTGAGDLFHGGYIYGLLQQWELLDVIRFASACAALKCRQLGGRQGIPRLPDVLEFMGLGGKV